MNFTLADLQAEAKKWMEVNNQQEEELVSVTLPLGYVVAIREGRPTAPTARIFKKLTEDVKTAAYEGGKAEGRLLGLREGKIAMIDWVHNQGDFQMAERMRRSLE